MVVVSSVNGGFHGNVHRHRPLPATPGRPFQCHWLIAYAFAPVGLANALEAEMDEHLGCERHGRLAVPEGI